MINLYIKTWGCVCGYRQDFEPTQGNADQHFNHSSTFGISDLMESECPSCAKRGERGLQLKRMIEEKDKIKVQLAEASDVSILEEQLDSSTKETIVTDRNERDETDEEFAKRIMLTVDSLGIKDAVEKDKAKTWYETNMKKKIVTTDERLEEPDVLHNERVKKAKGKIKFLTPEEITAFRYKHEDV
jgi:hypothetical protein